MNQDLNTFSKRVLRIGLACACSAGTLSSAWAGKPGETLGRKLSTVARMEREHLQAARDAVERYREQRADVVSRTPSLTDYRAILHAHAEDAAHTGGTRPEMLADAKKAGVQIILLSDHYRPPKDFITETWRGMHDGVLFIPGSETNGFLVHPMESIVDVMDKDKATIISRVTEGDGLIFLSHVEERVGHPMDGLTGMEIYNRHADAKDDMTALFSLIGQIADPVKAKDLDDRIREFPAEMLAMQLDYPELYMTKWDDSTPEQRVVGIAANDCHHNQVFIAKMVDENSVRIGTIVDPDDGMRVFDTSTYPSIAELTKGHQPGDILVSLDFDPYYVSFHNVSTHILSDALNEETVRKALKSGHAFVAHDWMCDPTGFQYLAYKCDPNAADATPAAIQGDEIAFTEGLNLYAEFPVECHIRLLRNGEVIADTNARTFEHAVESEGVYRIEGWLDVDTEDRIWIYSNPIYVR